MWRVCDLLPADHDGQLEAEEEDFDEWRRERGLSRRRVLGSEGKKELEKREGRERAELAGMRMACKENEV
jgi:hypothetical protein